MTGRRSGAERVPSGRVDLDVPIWMCRSGGEGMLVPALPAPLWRACPASAGRRPVTLVHPCVCFTQHLRNHMHRFILGDGADGCVSIKAGLSPTAMSPGIVRDRRDGDGESVRANAFQTFRPRRRRPSRQCISRWLVPPPGRAQGKKGFTMNRARAHARRWRRWAAAAMAAAATAACTVIGTSPAAYAVTIDPNAWYQIVSRHSGLALGIASSVTTDGARLIQTARRDQASQQF